MAISRANIGEYVQWDEVNQRYDLTPKMLAEQTDEDVRVVMEVVLRSWFIPDLTNEIKGWFERPKQETAVKGEKPELQLSLWG